MRINLGLLVSITSGLMYFGLSFLAVTHVASVLWAVLGFIHFILAIILTNK